MAKHNHASEAEVKSVVKTESLTRRELSQKKQADRQAEIDAHRAKTIEEFEAKVQAEKEAEIAELNSKPSKRLEGFTHLNPGQRITARGRIIAGWSIEDAVAFATKEKPKGRSEKAMALRAKHPKKFGKLDAMGNSVPPSAAKIAYLKAIKEKEASK